MDYKRLGYAMNSCLIFMFTSAFASMFTFAFAFTVTVVFVKGILNPTQKVFHSFH